MDDMNSENITSEHIKSLIIDDFNLLSKKRNKGNLILNESHKGRFCAQKVFQLSSKLSRK